MANKKTQGKIINRSKSPPERITFVGRRITAADAGWLSPTKFVAPIEFVPLDPPQPRPEKHPRTLCVPLQILVEVHEIQGGGYRAEVPRFPGCVAQAETIEALKENIIQAVDDWLNAMPVKTADEAGQFAEIQGSSQFVEKSFPQPNRHLPPASWNDEDE